MTTVFPPPDSSAEEQASLWAARLEGGTLTNSDRDALDAWLNAHPSHRTLLSGYCQFSVDLEERLLALVATGAVQPPPDSTPDEHASTPVQPRTWLQRNFKWLAPTGLAAAAVVALMIWVGRPGPKVSEVATTAAQRTALTLGDGTRVELNAHTSLSVALSAKERRVRLSGGEAFFTVSKDASRPFLIESPAGSVRVTGTVFNVRSEATADLDVAVVEGSVQVRPTGSTAKGVDEVFELRAHERLSASGGRAERTLLSAAELDDVLAWRRGQIVFRNVSLGEALQRFARFHDRKIIPSAAVISSGKSVGGRHSIDDLEGFLKSLEASHDVQVSHEAGGAIRIMLAGER